MSTCHRFDLQTLGSQLIMPKNVPDHWLYYSPFQFTSSQATTPKQKIRTPKKKKKNQSCPDTQFNNILNTFDHLPHMLTFVCRLFLCPRRWTINVKYLLGLLLARLSRSFAMTSDTFHSVGYTNRWINLGNCLLHVSICSQRLSFQVCRIGVIEMKRHQSLQQRFSYFIHDDILGPPDWVHYQTWKGPNNLST